MTSKLMPIMAYVSFIFCTSSRVQPSFELKEITFGENF